MSKAIPLELGYDDTIRRLTELMTNDRHIGGTAIDALPMGVTVAPTITEVHPELLALSNLPLHEKAHQPVLVPVGIETSMSERIDDVLKEGLPEGAVRIWPADIEENLAKPRGSLQQQLSTKRVQSKTASKKRVKNKNKGKRR